MSNHLGPRAGSRAYIVLEHLFRRADVNANVTDVRRVAAPNLTPGEFDCLVLTSLARFGFIVESDGIVTITPAGKRYMEPPVVDTRPAPALVASPYKPQSRDLVKRVRQLPIRAGAFDYLGIPSRHGDQRLPYSPPRSVVSADRK